MLKRLLFLPILLLACTYDYDGLQKHLTSDGSDGGSDSSGADSFPSGDMPRADLLPEAPGDSSPLADLPPDSGSADSTPPADTTPPDTMPPSMWTPSTSVMCDPSPDRVGTACGPSGKECASRLYYKDDLRSQPVFETKCVSTWYAGGYLAFCTRGTSTSTFPSMCSAGLTCVAFPAPAACGTCYTESRCYNPCRCIDGSDTCPKAPDGKPQKCYSLKSGLACKAGDTDSGGIGVCS